MRRGGLRFRRMPRRLTPAYELRFSDCTERNRKRCCATFRPALITLLKYGRFPAEATVAAMLTPRTEYRPRHRPSLFQGSCAGKKVANCTTTAFASSKADALADGFPVWRLEGCPEGADCADV